MIVTDTDKIFLMLIRRSLYGGREQLSDLRLSENPVDWAKVEEEAAVHAMSIAALEGTVGLENAGIPDDVLTGWQGKSVRFMMKNELLMKVQNKVISILAENGIKGAVIKGSSASVLYSNPELRVLGDIDYIVKEDDYERAIELLAQNGFQKETTSTNICHTEMFYKGCIIEIHRFINGLPAGKNGEYIRSVFDESLANNEICYESMSGYTFPVMNDVCIALTLLLHTQNHMTRVGLGLRHLCDWASFVQKKITPEFTEQITPILEKVGLLKFYNVLTETSRKFLLSENFALDASVSSSDKLCDMLVLDFISNGNFGRKTPETLHFRSIFTKTTVVQTKNGTKAKVKWGKNIKETLNGAMPVTKKHPILLPVGFVYVPIRYIFRVIKGERKMINAKFVSQTSTRRELYGSLDIFTSDEK